MDVKPIVVVPKFHTSATFDHTKWTGEKPYGKSMTRPEQGMSMKQLIKRWEAGQPLPPLADAQFHEEHVYRDPRAYDFTDLDNIRKANEAKHKQLTADIEEHKTLSKDYEERRIAQKRADLLKTIRDEKAADKRAD